MEVDEENNALTKPRHISSKNACLKKRTNVSELYHRDVKKRKYNDEEFWSYSNTAENESIQMFEIKALQYLSQNESFQALEEIKVQSEVLKNCKRFNEIETNILIDLISNLEGSINDVLQELVNENDKEVSNDKILIACNSALIILLILTSSKMPEKIYVENAIDATINLTKSMINQVIFPEFDSKYTSKNHKKHERKNKRKSQSNHNKQKSVEGIYAGTLKLILNFGQLAALNKVTEIGIYTLATLAVSTLFVTNIGTLQHKAIRLATIIFSKYSTEVRSAMLTDIVNSFHCQQLERNSQNSFSFRSGVNISNVTVLIIQLIQSIARMPSKKKDSSEANHDRIVYESFSEIQKFSGSLLQKLLSRCKGGKDEGDTFFQECFDKFVADLILIQNTPECPAAEKILSLLATLLVKTYRNEKEDLNLRLRSLVYLGKITAELRKNSKIASQEKEHLKEIINNISAKEQENDSSEKNVDIANMSNSDFLKKLEQALINYLDNANSEEYNTKYAILFYATEWYSETVMDIQDFSKSVKESSEKISKKAFKKLEKQQDLLIEKGKTLKEFIILLVDRKHRKERAKTASSLNSILSESDAIWAAQYIASRRDFSSLFKEYLHQILHGVMAENNITLRTQATKSLSQIIEADYEIFGMNDVYKVIVSRMLDTSPSVRESAVDLLGKFVIIKKEFVEKYYTILIERIRDSSVSVRKRVVLIIREICERYPNFEQLPKLLAAMVKRINDESGIKKLVVDVFTVHWFTNSIKFDLLTNKVVQIIGVTKHCIADQSEEFFVKLLQCIEKEKSPLKVFKNIVNSLVDNFILLDREQALEPLKVEENYLACLNALSIFSKVVPEYMVDHGEILYPYLSINTTSSTEQKVVNEVIKMLEVIVNLAEHPSEKFYKSIEERLANLVSSAGIAIIESAIRCSAAIWQKCSNTELILASKFLAILRDLNTVKRKLNVANDFQFPEAMMYQIERFIVIIGILTRYFDFDSILEKNEGATKCLDMSSDAKAKNVANTNRSYRDNVLKLICFFLHSSNSRLKQRALSSMGHICVQYAEYLVHPDVRNIYTTVLQSNSAEQLSLKVQTLRNLEMFLSNEDIKAIKSSEEWEKNKDKHNLKEMELTGSGLSSSVIQIYWSQVLKSYFNSSESVRNAAVQVICVTLNRGLVPPSSSVPILISITADPDEELRFKAEHVLKEIDYKHTGMILTNAIAGVRYAYIISKLLKPINQSCARGVRSCDSSVMVQDKGKGVNGLPKKTNDGQASLCYLYQILRENRFNRRTFISRLIGLFREDSQEKLNLEELIFVADNLALFPYQIVDEPLYIIKQIDNVISLFGQSLLNQFKEHLNLPKSNGSTIDDDEIFSEKNLLAYFPDDKTSLYNLMFKSQSCFILLSLRQFLIKLFRLDQNKIDEYSPSEAIKVHEKAVSRRNIKMFEAKSALEEFLPEVNEQRNTPNGAARLANNIHEFRAIMLSIAELDGEEDDGLLEVTRDM